MCLSNKHELKNLVEEELAIDDKSSQQYKNYFHIKFSLETSLQMQRDLLGDMEKFKDVSIAVYNNEVRKKNDKLSNLEFQLFSIKDETKDMENLLINIKEKQDVVEETIEESAIANRKLKKYNMILLFFVNQTRVCLQFRLFQHYYQ